MAASDSAVARDEYLEVTDTLRGNGADPSVLVGRPPQSMVGMVVPQESAASTVGGPERGPEGQRARAANSEAAVTVSTL